MRGSRQDGSDKEYCTTTFLILHPNAYLSPLRAQIAYYLLHHGFLTFTAREAAVRQGFYLTYLNIIE